MLGSLCGMCHFMGISAPRWLAAYPHTDGEPLEAAVHLGGNAHVHADEQDVRAAAARLLPTDRVSERDQQRGLEAQLGGGGVGGAADGAYTREERVAPSAQLQLQFRLLPHLHYICTRRYRSEDRTVREIRQ